MGFPNWQRTYKEIEISVIRMRSGWFRAIFQYPGYGPHIETPVDFAAKEHALSCAQDIIDHLENGETKKASLYKVICGEKAIAKEK